MSPKDVAATGSGCEMGGLSQDTTDGPDPQDEHLREEQRLRARNVGLFLVLAVVVIVAAVFAWKISLQR